MVNIYLRSINDIDDYKMEFSVQVTFREQWNDERLKFDDFQGDSNLNLDDFNSKVSCRSFTAKIFSVNKRGAAKFKLCIVHFTFI